MSYRDPKDAQIAALEAEILELKKELGKVNQNLLSSSNSYEVIKIDRISDNLAIIFVKDYQQGQLSQLPIESVKKLRLGSKVKWIMHLVEE